MGKLGWLSLGIVAALGGGAYTFYDMAVNRHNTVNLPEGKKSKEQLEKEKKRAAIIETAKVWVSDIPHETLTVDSYDGLKLVADLIPAETPTEDTIILVHGFRASGYKDFGAMLKFYHRLGLNILLVDDRGHGRSEGKYICYGWNDHFDVMKWIDLLCERYSDNAKIFLHGVSMGAATVMMVAGEKLPRQVKGVIEDCGYTSANEQFDHVLKSIFNITWGKPFIAAARTIALQLAKFDFNDCNSLKALAKTRLPFLFIHGSNDNFVPTEMVYRNYNACSSTKKTLQIIEGAGHAESYLVNTKLYEKVVTEFIDELRK